MQPPLDLVGDGLQNLESDAELDASEEEVLRVLDDYVGHVDEGHQSTVFNLI
jgi:hypothetical protein